MRYTQESYLSLDFLCNNWFYFFPLNCTLGSLVSFISRLFQQTCYPYLRLLNGKLNLYNEKTKHSVLQQSILRSDCYTPKKVKSSKNCTYDEMLHTLFYKIYVSFSCFLPKSIAGATFHAQNCAILLGDSALADSVVLLIWVLKCTQPLLALCSLRQRKKNIFCHWFHSGNFNSNFTVWLWSSGNL